jgi:small subunit ribosomal protein S3Ae
MSRLQPHSAREHSERPASPRQLEQVTLLNFKLTPLEIASDSLKGRVVETSLADLNDKSEQMAWRKVKLCVEEVQGRSCLTNFHGLDMTRDKYCSYLKKWQTTIEVHSEVKTNDGYILRIFVVAFTGRQTGQIRKCSYAQHAQVKRIRKAITEILTKEASSVSLQELVQKFTLDAIPEACRKAAQFIYPLSHVVLKKVKTLKKPKFDILKLNELYKEQPHKQQEGGAGKKGKGKADDEEPKNLLSQ